MSTQQNNLQNEMQHLGDNVERVAKEANKEVKKQMKKRGIQKSHLVLFLILIIALIIAGFFYNRYTKTDSYKTKKADKETKALLEKISKIMILPDEKPAVFVVQDPEILSQQQAFFKGAQKNDTLLVFPQSGKAVIYSQSRNLVVNVGPVTFDQTKGTTTTSTSVKEESPLKESPKEDKTN